MPPFGLRRMAFALSTLGLIGVSAQAYASAFQIWEQDGASIGSYHAGYAAEAADASIAFYNPAGITRFKNQQLVFSSAGVMPNIKFKGNLTVDTINNGNTILPATAQGGSFAFVPALHYVAPISERVGFGFSIDVPFAAKTNYGHSTDVRYAATQTYLTVIDYSPSFAFKMTDKASFGAGLDIQEMKAEFDQVGTIGGTELDTDGIDSADGSAFGYHLGALYEFNVMTRVGLSYHSQVVHHLTGTSRFSGPIAAFFGIPITSDRAKVNMTLPPYTALSLYHRVAPKMALMASAIYTQWNLIRTLTLLNASGILNSEPNTTITVTVPQYFQNSWNLSLGSDYYLTDRVTLRGGIGYDQTPVRDAYRTVQLPDNDRYVIAFGGHYQATTTLGVDMGWAHLFMNKAHIIPPPQVTGDQTVTTNGSVRAGADVLSAQLTWDLV